MPERAVPRPFLLLTLLSVGMSVGLGLSVGQHAPGAIDAFIMLIALIAAVSESYAPVVGGYSASLTFPLVMSALLLGGPYAGAVVAGVSALRPDSFLSAKGLVTTVYNFAQHTSVALIGGWLYAVLDGPRVPFHVDHFPEALIPLGVTAAICALGNIAFTAVGVSALYRENPRALLGSMFAYAPSLFALAGVGYLMAQVMAVNALGLPLFVFPLWVARQLYQSVVRLREAYTDTVRSLVSALETKDPYTRGHSERVAGYAVAIAKNLGVENESIAAIEHAGLLHDVGKVSISGVLLRKTTQLSPEERSVINRHPGDGALIIEKIPPLRDLATAIRQHHERPDGRGYPVGLCNEEICRDARILAVADCFDAMTTDRPYRPALSHSAALDELKVNSGTQFDPEVVEAFTRSMTPPEESYASDAPALLSPAEATSLEAS